MTDIGKFNKLTVKKKVKPGLYLDGNELGDILLPRRYCKQSYNTGDIIEVFVYRDSEDRLVATTEKPYAAVGEVAFLKVVMVNKFGAFLDWGLPKDLLVPFREQKGKMIKDQSYMVYIYLDLKTDRIIASTKLGKFLNKRPPKYDTGEQVELLIYQETEMGYKAIINNSHWGLLYKQDIYRKLKFGQTIPGYISKLREDGKIDISLQKPGYEKVEELSEKILKILREKGGFISLTDNTAPKIIYSLFGVSKKTFKKAVGALYKNRRITIEPDGIKLIEKE
jgi:predicted RNA-binding protein (virulence factor B family)